MASSITHGNLSTAEDSYGAFHIGVEDVNKVVNLCRSLISQKKQFAVLVPMSIVGEIARLDNSDGERSYLNSYQLSISCPGLYWHRMLKCG